MIFLYILNESAASLVQRLHKASTAYGMELSAKEDQADDKQHQRHQQGDQSKWTEAGDSHKLLVQGLSESVVSDEGSKPEILSKIAQTTAALTRLKPVGNDRSISLNSKIRLIWSLVKLVVKSSVVILCY